MSGAEKVLIAAVKDALETIGRDVPRALAAGHRGVEKALVKDAETFEAAEAAQAAKATALRQGPKAPPYKPIHKPNDVVVRGKYTYYTDGVGRVHRVTGRLEPGTGGRLNKALARRIRDMGIAKDQAGHLIARIFKGSPDDINLLPQNGNFNMGRWRVMEKQWQKLLLEKPPHVIEVDIHAVYGDASGRPTSYEVEWTDNGVPSRRTFGNGPGGR